MDNSRSSDESVPEPSPSYASSRNDLVLDPMQPEPGSFCFIVAQMHSIHSKKLTSAHSKRGKDNEYDEATYILSSAM